MSERLVGLRHLVRIVAFLDRIALVLERVRQFQRQRLAHRHALAAFGVVNDPAERQAHLAVAADFDRHLIGRAADAAALHFQVRLDILQRLLEDRQGILLRQLLELRQRAVHDALRRGLFAALHDAGDQPRHDLAAKARVRRDRLFFRSVPSRHSRCSLKHFRHPPR